MKKGWIVLGVVVAVAVAALCFGWRYGFRVGPWSITFSKDKAELYRKTERFLECLKFKEFDEAASFHAPGDAEGVDIAELIWQVFKVKHEQLDIQRWDEPIVELDSTGKLAVTKTTTTVKVLNTGHVRDAEVNFYWKKHGDGWRMYLRSSLPGEGYRAREQR